jgi:deazaflavin-dependent oxidoreductase (nitroreductase family)
MRTLAQSLQRSTAATSSTARGRYSPGWYHNLVAGGSATVEVGTDSLPVSVRELAGRDRERVFAEQARRYPNFGEYEQRTAGIRTIPVLELRRA